MEASFVPTIDLSFFVLDGLVLFFSYVKDIADEVSMQRGGDPVGPNWFEHTPFMAMTALHGAVIALIDPPSIFVTVYWVFVVLFLIDFVWDITQDVRASPER